jgi:hypothetical protein
MTATFEEDQQLAESLIGRTIVRALWRDAAPQQEWDHQEDCWLWLDDGRVIEFSSYGYDVDGATINEITVMDIASCLHCGAAHKDQQVFVEPLGRPYAYCVNGNDHGWRSAP